MSNCYICLMMEGTFLSRSSTFAGTQRMGPPFLFLTSVVWEVHGKHMGTEGPIIGDTSKQPDLSSRTNSGSVHLSWQLTVGKNYPLLKYKSQLRCSIRGSILEWCLRSLISLNILEKCSEDSSLQTHLFATFQVGIYIPATSITLIIYNPNHD